MKWPFALLFPLALVACATKPTGYRDTSVTMLSIVSFDATTAAGQWVEVNAIGRTPGGSWQFTPTGAQTFNVNAQGLSGPASKTGEGRFALAGQDIRVLWVDTNYRTLVLGTPDGSFASVLNRDADLPPDRAKVIRQVLEWNGYSLAALR